RASVVGTGYRSKDVSAPITIEISRPLFWLRVISPVELEAPTRLIDDLRSTGSRLEGSVDGAARIPMIIEMVASAVAIEIRRDHRPTDRSEGLAPIQMGGLHPPEVEAWRVLLVAEGGRRKLLDATGRSGAERDAGQERALGGRARRIR